MEPCPRYYFSPSRLRFSFSRLPLLLPLPPLFFHLPRWIVPLLHFSAPPNESSSLRFRQQSCSHDMRTGRDAMRYCILSVDDGLSSREGPAIYIPRAYENTTLSDHLLIFIKYTSIHLDHKQIITKPFDYRISWPNGI